MEETVHPLAKLVRLQNGDDIIAEVIETEDDNGIVYTVFHPLKVVYMPSGTSGYLSIAFMPWVFPRICDQQEFNINAEDVLMMIDVTEKMNEYYWDSIDTYINESKKEEPQHEDPTDEATILEALNQLGIKRTFH